MDTTQLERDITALTATWMSLVGPDHHKDRDCHWYIERRWSYGYPPVWTVLHYGYIGDEVDHKVETYHDALVFLKAKITQAIATWHQHDAELD